MSKSTPLYKQEQAVFRFLQGIISKPKEGYESNPYLKYPRNNKCYCGSNKKFKKCCLSTEALAVPKEVAEVAKGLIEQVKELK